MSGNTVFVFGYGSDSPSPFSGLLARRDRIMMGS